MAFNPMRSSLIFNPIIRSININTAVPITAVAAARLSAPAISAFKYSTPLAQLTTGINKPYQQQQHKSSLLRSTSLYSFQSTRSMASMPQFNSESATGALNTATAFINKLQTASVQQLFHYSHFALAGLAPIALILSPSILNLPVDLLLGLIIPVHAHIGSTYIIEDYIPRSNQPLVKAILLFSTVLASIGLLKINLCGSGLTESIKSLWRPTQPKSEKKKSKKSSKKITVEE